MDLLGKFYEWGQRLDRARQTSRSLPAPVVSVGNIAVGGRGKTPLVIAIAQALKTRGWQPVVLTRGYGRKSALPFTISEETLAKATYSNCGDEPLEIFIRARVPVLVGPDRAYNADLYLQNNPALNRIIFVLDDGFQHWKLNREIDVVIVTDQDLHGGLLPLGNLREMPTALTRADLILKLGENFRKSLIFPGDWELPNTQLRPGNTWAFTTRAGSQQRYFSEISNRLGFKLHYTELKDHQGNLSSVVAKLPIEVEHLILGYKEAVKVLPIAELGARSVANQSVISGRKFKVHIIGLEVTWPESEFYKLLIEKKLEPQK